MAKAGEEEAVLLDSARTPDPTRFVQHLTCMQFRSLVRISLCSAKEPLYSRGALQGSWGQLDPQGA